MQDLEKRRCKHGIVKLWCGLCQNYKPSIKKKKKISTQNIEWWKHPKRYLGILNQSYQLCGVRQCADNNNNIRCSQPVYSENDTLCYYHLKCKNRRISSERSFKYRANPYRSQIKHIGEDKTSREKSKKAITVIEQLNIPLEGNDQVHFNTESGLHVATGYQRIVIGDRGPYVEFSSHQVVRENLFIPKQRHVYFTEWRSNDESNVMVYDQKRTVKYADYKVGLYYISPTDLYVEGDPVMAKATAEAGLDI